ncbi:ABC transporter permease, partial [Rhizobium ruizarguesonis]
STVALSAFAFATGLLLVTGGALGKLSGNRMLRMLLDIYTKMIRAVPELSLIVGLYYAGTDGLNLLLAALELPPVNVNGCVAAVAVLGCVQGAYMTEVL